MTTTNEPIRPYLSIFASELRAEDGNYYKWEHPMGVRAGDVIITPTTAKKHTVTGSPSLTRGADLVEVPVADPDMSAIFVPHAIHILRMLNV